MRPRDPSLLLASAATVVLQLIAGCDSPRGLASATASSSTVGGGGGGYASTTGSGGHGGDAPCVTIGKSPDTRLTPRGAFPQVWAPPAWTGNGFGVVFADARDAEGSPNATEIYFQATTAAGKRDGDNVRVTHSNGGAMHPALAWNGAAFGVVWDEGSKIHFTTIDGASHAVGPDVVVASSGVMSFPQIAWAGDRYAIAWIDFTGASATLPLQIVGPDGAPIGVAGVMASSFTVNNASTSGYNFGLTAVGTSYALAVRGSDGVHVILADAAGAVSSEHVAGSTTDAIYPSITPLASGFVATWEASDKQVMSQRLDPTGAPMGAAALIVDIGDAVGILSNAATDGDSYAFAVAEEATAALYHVDGMGTVTKLPLATSWMFADLAIGWTGTDFAMAWQPLLNGESYEVMLARLGPCPEVGGDDSPVACVAAKPGDGADFPCGTGPHCKAVTEYCQVDEYTATYACHPLPAGCGPSCGWVLESRGPADCDGYAVAGCSVDAQGNVVVSCDGK